MSVMKPIFTASPETWACALPISARVAAAIAASFIACLIAVTPGWKVNFSSGWLPRPSGERAGVRGVGLDTQQLLQHGKLLLKLRRTERLDDRPVLHHIKLVGQWRSEAEVLLHHHHRLALRLQ